MSADSTAEGPLAGFSDQRDFTLEALANVPNEPGVHVVWGPDGELLYVGMSRQTRDRLRMHQTGDRAASVLHSAVGDLLDDELGRVASRDQIADWLSSCSFSWLLTSEKERIKAQIMDELNPRFNMVRPNTPSTEEDGSTWDEFCRWAGVFFSDANFDEIERDYKLSLGTALRAARDAMDSGGEFLEPIRAALSSRDNNLVRWNQAEAISDWAARDPEGCRNALGTLWNGQLSIEERLQGFFESFPSDVLSGSGMRATVASVFLLADDPALYSPYKPQVLGDGYALVGFTSPVDPSDSASRYLQALSFFDRILDECRQRGIALRDRLDAQCVLWSVLKNDLPDGVSTSDSAAFEVYRGAGQTTWWVNQGVTYATERSGSFVWAPQRTKGGFSVKHHTDVGRIRRGHVIIHYANGSIRALGRATRAGGPAERPPALPGDAWESSGLRADIKYFDLDTPIALDEIPMGVRVAEPYAFNKNGAVNQGYLYPISPVLADELREYFEDRWPAGSPWSLDPPSYWLFQSNPRYFDLPAMLAEKGRGGADDWVVSAFRHEMRAGDRVVLWQSGQEAGVYGLATLTSLPIERSEDEAFFGKSGEWGVDLVADHVLDPPLLRRDLLNNATLSGMSVIRAPQGTNFRVTNEEWNELMHLIESPDPPQEVGVSSLADAIDEFTDAVTAAGLSFDPQFVRAFVVSLATKGFVLLTGLSGSGKTRLAQSFGRWLGNDRALVVPVRPDWTGPEALLGYENGLSTTGAWRVPRSLEFMLRAAEDPHHPYLLLLDEMNLAHVERYFADVLSGIESGEAVLPNLEQVSLGERVEWQQVEANPYLPWPENLVVVGTVNIDETTYMFSPKVLDRANTLEFRVPTEALGIQSKSNLDLAPGSPASVATFHAYLTGDDAIDGWPGVSDFASRLQELHEILRVYDREFGHRVFVEALRFGSIWQSSGPASTTEALDLQILQKVLPRLHGSIRQVARPLAAVGSWACFGSVVEGFDPRSADPETIPVLPLTFDKVRRMTSRLYENHFVSFAE